jgi:hypothetical protein
MGVVIPQNTGLPDRLLIPIVQDLVMWLLVIFGFLAIISFLISGIMYLMASGDDKAQEKAKKQMQWSITGVIVGLMGLVIVIAIDRLLRGGSMF